MEQEQINFRNDTIAAISTPPGVGGIAVIRIAGPEAIDIVAPAWKGIDLKKSPSHTVHLGKYLSKESYVLDECVATVYRAPNSFTGDNIIELSVHGSGWIQREILKDLVKRGARIAGPGEFTLRAFLNGKMDLAQAEGVADLIASSSKAAHDMAVSQVKGTFSKEFSELHAKLVEFASLLELELDFSEEEVEFADRTALIELCDKITAKISGLANSYSTGLALKDGVTVAIAGIPNAGKSSLLNLLAEDDKAIVTDIPGTTRDIIEETVELDGILYRFIDTAGLRETGDVVEGIGVERARKAIDKAVIVIWVLDPFAPENPQIEELNRYLDSHPEGKLLLLQNKSDILGDYKCREQDCRMVKDKIGSGKPGIQKDIMASTFGEMEGIILFSAKTGEGLDELKSRLKDLATDKKDTGCDIIVTNARHFEALTKALESLNNVQEGLKTNISSELIAQDIHETLHHLSEITGEITSSDILHSIFSRFCIGK